MPSLETLLQESVVELRIRFLVRGQCVPEGLLEALEVDSRVAARELARKIRSRRFRNRAEGQRLRNLLRFEVELWSKGISLIAGVDEAGMAPLAGPVGGGAGNPAKEYPPRGVGDSQKIQDKGKRAARGR